MSRNYKTRRELESEYSVDMAAWGAVRETCPAIATAIHAIADSSRLPHDIWEAPTTVENQHIAMAVEEYVNHGDFAASDDGRYAWGDGALVLPHAA